MPSESGSHQYMASSVSGFYLQPKDMNGSNHSSFLLTLTAPDPSNDASFGPAGLCQLDTGSEADLEAAIDPLLCHYQGPIGSLLRRDRMYPGDPSDDFTGR